MVGARVKNTPKSQLGQGSSWDFFNNGFPLDFTQIHSLAQLTFSGIFDSCAHHKIHQAKIPTSTQASMHMQPINATLLADSSYKTVQRPLEGNFEHPEFVPVTFAILNTLIN